MRKRLEITDAAGATQHDSANLYFSNAGAAAENPSVRWLINSAAGPAETIVSFGRYSLG